MKNHVYRPLIVVFGIVAAILIAREIVVPDDFGAHEAGYMYGWHRKGNETDWKNFKVKYQGKQYCATCHPDKIETIDQSPHTVINCENCHGPAIKEAEDGTFTKHGEDVFTNEVNRARTLCLRCHAYLPYVGSGRENVRGINNNEHNPDMECVMCHDPHSPGFS